jgi:hypothetical protein
MSSPLQDAALWLFVLSLILYVALDLAGVP